MLFYFGCCNQTEIMCEVTSMGNLKYKPFKGTGDGKYGKEN